MFFFFRAQRTKDSRENEEKCEFSFLSFLIDVFFKESLRIQGVLISSPGRRKSRERAARQVLIATVAAAGEAAYARARDAISAVGRSTQI